MKQNKYSLGNKLSNEFLNKKIIVTGASSGIGLTTALYFLNCGAKVILAGRDIKTMKKICEDNKFYNAIIMKLELKDDISIYDFKTSVVERFKTIDILVNCAGVKMDGDLEKTYPQDFDYTLDVNLRSMFYLINNLSSFMEKNSSIINMSCLYGTNPMAGMISHNVSKAGLEALTRYAAAEFSGFGIRVNAITACPVDTNSMRLMQVENSEIEKFNKNMEKNIPLGRIARPDDITKVIVFLASERSKNITGQIIRVDGGRGLTSSGYVHYRGMMNMNSRFEPDGEKKQINNLFGLGDLIGVKIKKKEEVPKDEKELKRFINNKIKESNFSTNLSDAFASSNPSYKIVDNNDQRLTDKFLKGKNPNPLYDLKKYKKQIYGKNTGFASVNIIMNNDSMQMPNQNLNRTQIKPAMSFNNNLQNNNFNLNKSNGPEDSKPNYN
jgi:3-oxoacyl-[acyl-carrier protein] reductase